jgi:hypothetical protein
VELRSPGSAGSSLEAWITCSGRYWSVATRRWHELLIFFSTLGGLLLFGVMGFILGPILAALFVTVWEMFGLAFRSSLAEPMPITPGADSGPE